MTRTTTVHRRVAAASLAAIAIALAAPAAAQTATNEAAPAQDPQPNTAAGFPQDDAQATEVVVTGYRAALNAALEEKRLATGVVDVIKAEDIADFPDNNLAESIQRIPGVAITRDQGEGRNITVRGLGPLYTRVRINGIEGLSTTGGADSSGGANRGRGFDFNVFASELFNTITVRKTPSADIEEGSLGATVDLQTGRPFDYKDDLVLVGTAQVGLNDLSHSVDPKFSALASTKFFDDKVGVLVSASYSKRGIAEEGPSTVRWERGTDNGGFAAASTLPTGATQGFGFFAPRIPRYDSYSYETERLGLTASIQFKPTDRTLIGFDALYANFKSDRAEQYLEAISFSRSGTGKPQTVILPGAQVDATNSLVRGTFNNVDVRVESRFDQLETKFQQYTGTLHQEFGDRIRFDALGGYSKSAFDNPIQTTVALDVNNVQGYSYDFTNGRSPTFNYGNLNVANANAYTLGEIRLRPQYVDNDFRVGRAQLEFDATDAIKLRIGGDYKRYGFSSEEYRRASETAVPTLAAGQLATLTRLYSFDPDTNLGGTPGTFVIPDLQKFADVLGIYSGTGTYALTGINNASAQGNFRTVRERDLGAFAQAAFNFDIGNMRVRGDAGVRYVETKQRSTGYTGGATNPRQVVAENSYDNWLPSANLTVDVTRDVVVRGAIARVIARPDIGTLSPGGSFSISGGNRTFSRGNPFINPTKATTYDLGVEWYFAPESAITVGGFIKDISTFVATTAQQIPFNELGLPSELLAGTTVVPTDLFVVTQPINSSGGKLKGFEVGLQLPFRFLPGVLRNFGVQANYTYVDSDIVYPLSTAANAATVTQPLINLSKHGANGTLYYEDKIFSIRGSVAYRSGYLTNVPGRNGLNATAPNAATPTFNDVEGVRSTLNVDMSSSLKVTENVSLTFEAINLTDQYVDQYIDSAANRLSVYHHTGRQYYFGARFKF